MKELSEFPLQFGNCVADFNKTNFEMDLSMSTIIDFFCYFLSNEISFFTLRYNSSFPEIMLLLTASDHYNNSCHI